MKNSARKLLALLLALCTLLSLSVLSSCGKTGDTMLSLGSAKITDKMFTFWLSRYKAQFLYAYGDSLKEISGTSDAETFWQMKVDSSVDARTYDELFTEYVYDNAMTYLVSLYLYDEFGLKLPEETEKMLEDTINEMMEDLAGGSKNEFNATLAQYGFNLDTLRACYEINEKVNQLQNYIFSDNGPEKITSDVLDDYYEKTYVRMSQICIFYDQCPEKDENGSYNVDSEGNIIYRNMSEAEKAAARAKSEEALAKINAGTDFATVAAEYNENTESDIYTDGIYLSSDNVYASGSDAALIYETLLSMNEGEVKLIELEHTLHIIRKLPLTARAYENSVNIDFFTFYDSSVQNYVSFSEYVKTPLYLEYIEKKKEELKDKIKVDEDVKARQSIATVNANSTF